MYVERNNEGGSCNHCCGGRAMSITYSESFDVLLTVHRSIILAINQLKAQILVL